MSVCVYMDIFYYVRQIFQDFFYYARQIFQDFFYYARQIFKDQIVSYLHLQNIFCVFKLLAIAGNLKRTI